MGKDDPYLKGETFMNISKENFKSEMLEKHAPSVLSVIGVTVMLEAAVINKKRQEELANAYSCVDASWELYREEVKRKRSIFYRVKMFLKRLFHK